MREGQEEEEEDRGAGDHRPSLSPSCRSVLHLVPLSH